MKVLKISFFAILYGLYSSGCANVVNSNDVERYLNSIVGKQYEPPIGWPMDGWKKINENSTSLELELVKKSGCSYAIKIDKSSNTVQSWRFTSPRNNCGDNYAPLI